MPEPVFEVRRAADRYVTTADGLVSRHAFSFGEHYDPANVGHGALLVSNEDVVQLGRGYDNHPHRDAEIVTWVLSGSLLHEDSSGRSGLVHPGLAQRMSAGGGIVHAERNDGYRIDPTLPPVPVHFVQMWARPDLSGGPASYEQRSVAAADLAASWVPVASGAEPDAAVGLGNASATLWVTVLGPGVRRTLPEAPYGHLSVARGEVEVEGIGTLATGDSLRVTGRAALTVTGLLEAELLIWGTGA